MTSKLPYKVVKATLWLALGTTLWYAAMRPRLASILVLATAIAAAWLFWLTQHRAEVAAIRVARRARGQQYIRESREPWKAPPSEWVIFAVLLSVGIGSLWAAFSVETEPPNGFLRQLLFSVLGPTGTTGIAAFGGAYSLCTAAESAVGARQTSET